MPISPFVEHVVSTPRPSTSSSLSIAEVEPFLQGVELSLPRHYQKGIIKIHAGEDSHQVRPNAFGQPSSNLFPDRRYHAEFDHFDPVGFLKTNQSTFTANAEVVVPWASSLSENISADGTIEPLTIRSEITFTSLFSPTDPHAFRGNLESGNWNNVRNADRIVAQQKFTDRKVGQLVFRDEYNAGYGGDFQDSFGTTSTTIFPFDDAQQICGHFVTGTMDSTLQVYINQMTPDTSNYVPFGYFQATTGFDD